jgi:hypothetical protein
MGPGQAGDPITEHAVLRVAGQEPAKRDEPLGDYDQFVDSIGVISAQRSQRELAGRPPFLQRHPDIRAWMVRPTAARRGELHRLKAAVPDLAADRSAGPGRSRVAAGQAGRVNLGQWWIIAHATAA